MAVHCNGHAGHKGYIVLAVHDLKVGGVCWQHLFDLIYSVGEGFIVNVEVENVPVLKLGKVGKKPSTTHAAVPSQHAVGAFAAHGQRGFGQMTNALAEYSRRYAVINRQQDVDLGDLDIPHDPFGSEI